jgi:hypothetical protein
VPKNGTGGAGLYASLWPAADGSNSSAAWTVVARATTGAHSGPAVEVTLSPPAGARWHYYDLYHGKELPAPSGGMIALDLEVSGYGAVLATKNTTAMDPVLASHGRVHHLNAPHYISLVKSYPYKICKEGRLNDGIAPARSSQRSLRR